MIKTENDYIAEYVKAKKPHILKTLNFVAWKTTAMSKQMKKDLASNFKKAMNDEMEIKAADFPEFEDRPYYDYITERGKEYCKKHRGSDSCLCGSCPLSENLFCINELGTLIINEDCTNLEAAASQYKYMFKEVTKDDQDNDVAK